MDFLPPHLCSIKALLTNTQTLLTRKKQNIMNALKNKVQLIGNLGSAPEMKTTETGRPFIRFTMATNESYKNNKGEKITDTQWHNIIAWGNTAELMGQLLQKGNEVVIEGKLVNRNFIDKDGNKRNYTEVVANEFFVITRKAA
jgi:single-strand DNA-binding protein